MAVYSQSFIVLVKLPGSSFGSPPSFVFLKFLSARIANRFFLLLILKVLSSVKVNA